MSRQHQALIPFRGPRHHLESHKITIHYAGLVDDGHRILALIRLGNIGNRQLRRAGPGDIAAIAQHLPVFLPDIKKRQSARARHTKPGGLARIKGLRLRLSQDGGRHHPGRLGIQRIDGLHRQRMVKHRDFVNVAIEVVARGIENSRPDPEREGGTPVGAGRSRATSHQVAVDV